MVLQGLARFFRKRTIPEYVGYRVLPQPYVCSNCCMLAFFFHADAEKLAALCQMQLNLPFNQNHHFMPLSSYVMVTFTHMPEVTAGPPDEQIGYSTETEVAFWLLIANKVKAGGRWLQLPNLTRIATFAPWMFVDNPPAITGGREVFGFAKEWGQVTMPFSPHQIDKSLTLDVVGLQTYSPQTKATVQRLLTITPGTIAPNLESHLAGSSVGKRSPQWEDIPAAFQQVHEALPQKSDAIPDHLSMLEAAMKKLTSHALHSLPIVFLKQFRAIEDSKTACYQAITEVTPVISRIAGGLLHDTFTLTIEPIASHAVTDTFGIQNSQSSLSYWLEFDMTMGFGETLCSATNS